MAETTILELAKPFRAMRNWHTDMDANLDLLDQLTIVARFTNKDTQDLETGDVVKLDTANDNSILGSDTENDADAVGVVFEDAIFQQVGDGLVIVIGYCEQVKVTGDVEPGDYLTTSSTALHARKAEWYEVAFARAISEDDGGTCEAILFQPPVFNAGEFMVCRFDVGLFDFHLFGT